MELSLQLLFVCLVQTILRREFIVLPTDCLKDIRVIDIIALSFESFNAPESELPHKPDILSPLQMRHIAVSEDQKYPFQIDVGYVPLQVNDNMLVELLIVLLKVVVDPPRLLLLDQALFNHVLSP